MPASIARRALFAAPLLAFPAFAVTQGLVLILFIVVGIAAVRRYRPALSI